jgi:hypothetical protein
MAIGMLLDIPGGTKEAYEAMNQKLFGSAGPGTPEGILVHTAGATESGWRIFDVWESREALDSFMTSRVGPAAQELGMTDMPRPEIYELENVLIGETSAV